MDRSARGSLDLTARSEIPGHLGCTLHTAQYSSRVPVGLEIQVYTCEDEQYHDLSKSAFLKLVVQEAL